MHITNEACFPLQGRLVSLSPFTSDDVTDSYIGWLNDCVVTRFSNQRFVSHDRASCLRYLASFEGTDNMFIAVRRLADGHAIGTMTAYRSPRHGTVDVGIMLGERSAWGKGFGQDAWNTLTHWLLDQPSTRKVTAGTLACNLGMVKLMERSGMQLEAVRKSQEIVEGRPEDILYYARFAGA